MTKPWRNFLLRSVLISFKHVMMVKKYVQNKNGTAATCTTKERKKEKEKEKKIRIMIRRKDLCSLFFFFKFSTYSILDS